jgi:melibiose permease
MCNGLDKTKNIAHIFTSNFLAKEKTGMTNMEDELQHSSWATKINYGIGAMGKSLSNGLYGNIQMFLLNVLRINKGFLAPMFFIGRLWDGANDLLMGVVIDNTKSRFGKFRPWIAIGAVTNALTVVAMFGVPTGLDARPMWLAVYVMVFYLLWDATYTMVDVAYYAMIPALSFTPKERDQFAMIPRIFSAVVGIATAFSMKIVQTLGGGEGEEFWRTGFVKYALITSAAYILTSVYSAARVK